MVYVAINDVPNVVVPTLVLQQSRKITYAKLLNSW